MMKSKLDNNTSFIIFLLFHFSSHCGSISEKQKTGHQLPNNRQNSLGKLKFNISTGDILNGKIAIKTVPNHQLMENVKVVQTRADVGSLEPRLIISTFILEPLGQQQNIGPFWSKHVLGILNDLMYRTSKTD